MRRRTAFAPLVAGVLAAGAAAASAATVGPLVQVSGVSPFAGCSADNAAAQTGTYSVGTEVEPSVAVRGPNVVGAWQQDRWSNGGSRGIGWSSSSDGGTTWTAPAAVPGLTLCAGGEFQRATDPWVTFSPDGTAYLFSLTLNDSDVDHALLVHRSSDGGQTWGPPQTVLRENNSHVFNDKNSITADPTSSAFVYAVWDRLVFPSERSKGDASARRALAYRGPTWFARSTDGGATWEAARPIYDPGQNNQTIGNQIAVLGDGTLVNIFDEILNFKNTNKRRGLNVAVMMSSDKGASWGRRVVVDKLGAVGVSDPDTGAPVRTGDIIPYIATSGRNVYAVWQDARLTGGVADQVLFSQSEDGGLTWSPAIRVSQSPGSVQAFTPAVDVRPDGSVMVTYYDFRNNDSTTPLWTDYWAVSCASNCASTSSWQGNETRLTDTPFDMAAAPVARGYFTGDYEGLANDGSDFLTFFSQSHGSDGASVFARRVAP